MNSGQGFIRHGKAEFQLFTSAASKVGKSFMAFMICSNFWRGIENKVALEEDRWISAVLNLAILGSELVLTCVRIFRADAGVA